MSKKEINRIINYKGVVLAISKQEPGECSVSANHLLYSGIHICQGGVFQTCLTLGPFSHSLQTGAVLYKEYLGGISSGDH
jgi:hypothetical protein